MEPRTLKFFVFDGVLLGMIYCIERRSSLSNVFLIDSCQVRNALIFMEGKNPGHQTTFKVRIECMFLLALSTKALSFRRFIAL